MMLFIEIATVKIVEKFMTKLNKCHNVHSNSFLNVVQDPDAESGSAELLENLIGKKQLAQKLSLSVAMIDKLMAKGLPYYKLGRSVRFSFVDVMDFLQKRRFP